MTPESLCDVASSQSLEGGWSRETTLFFAKSFEGCCSDLPDKSDKFLAESQLLDNEAFLRDKTFHSCSRTKGIKNVQLFYYEVTLDKCWDSATGGI